ncbi:MAG TPA: alpha/beta hydrolase [Fimbriimonadaceae bacterium]|nr:alpha/beta hydrolase [Fimbriimonadaceae bacterium]
MTVALVLTALLAAQTDPKRVDLLFDRDVVYRPVGTMSLTVDVLRGKEARAARPAILFFHGGNWTTGSKDRPPEPFSRLAREGFVCIAVDTRLAPGAKFPAPLEDAREAVRWTRMNAERYGIDPAKIGVWGINSGGNLAALLGTTGDGETKVQAVVVCSAPTDFARLVALRDSRMEAKLRVARLQDRNGLWPEELLLGGSVVEMADLAAKANPAASASPDDPPFLIVHGEDDSVVFPEQSRLLQDALKKEGVRSELRLVPRASHEFRELRAEDRIVDFFKRELLGDTR